MSKYSHAVFAWNDDPTDRLPIACNDEGQARSMFAHVLTDAGGYQHAQLCERVGETEEFREVDSASRDPHATHTGARNACPDDRCRAYAREGR